MFTEEKAEKAEKAGRQAGRQMGKTPRMTDMHFLYATAKGIRAF